MNSNNIPLVLNSLSNTTTIEQSIGASITNTTTNTTTYVYTALTISNFISLVASLSVMSERCVEIFWGCSNCILFYIFKVCFKKERTRIMSSYVFSCFEIERKRERRTDTYIHHHRH